ncbi:PREDICTED: putative receptor-like protein kinase At3g46340 isoform X1 [Brassica oleracea var. oleracea]|uniref:non-specific serine/threonine protein kinase n=1 Tax=Brassica oleracea var. oleracea TaxID=109376 RepID=A0A0D3D0N4_BRAOL|nr:PREDICTED: putative receptor-like protein kinase At3g46340 isoform X1 [Brassica oleracea var. oleracea]
MESPRGILLVALIATFAVIHFSQAEDQEGFISLDCGLPPSEASPYIEPDTGLWFSSDSDFIQSGKIGRIDASLPKTLKSYVTLRYFPEGIRNCYNLSVKQGTNYLMRVTALYGNYDGLNITPKFDLYVGPNFWVMIDLEKRISGQTEEIIYIPRSNSLDLCLVKTGPTTPIISSLELRPLANNLYITESGALKGFKRYYLTSSDTILSYPNDVSDRIWEPKFDPEWKHISTTLEANNSNGFAVPQNVLKTAVVPANATARFNITEELDFPGDEIYLYIHFSEVQSLQMNESREFDIFWNDQQFDKTISPEYLKATTIKSTTPVTCKGGVCNLELIRTTNSTLPPLLNAIELYAVVKFHQLETNENDVVAIRKIKERYGLNRITWQGDPCVPQKFLWDNLNCSSTDTSRPPRITYLNLTSSGLKGFIAAAIQNLTHLEKLDLSNNNLTGEIPGFLADMKSLMLINLSKNNLIGFIPQALLERESEGLTLFVDGENRCLSGSCVTEKKFPVKTAAFVSSATALVIMVILVLIFVFKKKKSPNSEALPPSSIKPSANVASTNISEISIDMKRKKFTYSEVMEMTNNLERPLGEGGFGIVYHGVINGSQQVAVKLLSQSSRQGHKEFKAEVELLLRVHHINLVSLVGCCDERDHLALIYEYMSNGDLKHHLSGKQGSSVLKWSTRLQIAIDAALGLEYLHNGCRPSMVHRDVKSTNILLDEKFSAKLADFGLSRSFQFGDEYHVSTDVAGTPGYLDPEYYRTGRLAEMSDVYSFGILLLEIITNQRVLDQTREKSHIGEWTAFMLNRGDITGIMDLNLHGDYSSHSAWRALELAMLCANPSSEKRPNMSQVAFELKECLTSEISMKSKDQDMDSQSSPEVSMSCDTKGLPSAR